MLDDKILAALKSPAYLAGFLARISKRGPDECWPWMNTTRCGYGRVHVPGARQSAAGAHRMMWLAIYGEIQNGLFVCHTCDNPPCCNPAHLFLGTNAENTADRVKKNRSDRSPKTCLPGALNPSARLTKNDVLRIRELHANGISGKQIAAMIGCGASTVYRIWRRTSWKDVS